MWIIDGHCHAGPGDRLSGPWDTRADLTRYLTRCDRAGIRRGIIFAALAKDYTLGNESVAKLVAEHWPRLQGFVFLRGDMSEHDVKEQVQRHVVQHGMVGIKCHRHDAPISREICEIALRHQLPVLYDVGGEVASIELFATEYPQVNFIIPHLGSFADDWKAQLAIADHLVRHPNVYTDTAGCRRFDFIVEAIKRAGPRKVIFGSDGPWLHPGLELEKIKLLRLSADQYAQIVGGNILRLLGARGRAWANVSAYESNRPAIQHWNVRRLRSDFVTFAA
jgi:uncharacterized protein